MIELRTNMGLFDFDVLTIIGTYEDAIEYIRWKYRLPDDEVFDYNLGYEPRGKTFFRAGFVPIIWVPAPPKKPREIATLAHEALHAVYYLHDWAGIPVGKETEEMTAHAQAHIVTSALEQLSIKKLKEKSNGKSKRN